MSKRKPAPVKEERTFSKQALIKSERYRLHTDALSALLEDGVFYSLSEVDNLIESFLKGKVK